jgi:hypothetical protein
MKTLAELKRNLKVGTSLVMTRHDWNPHCPLIGVTRKIQIKQVNAIQFEPMPGKREGSWLYWRSAKEVVVRDNEFDVELEPGSGKFMSYKIVK